jgi:hypothetical protein
VGKDFHDRVSGVSPCQYVTLYAAKEKEEKKQEKDEQLHPLCVCVIKGDVDTEMENRVKQRWYFL